MIASAPALRILKQFRVDKSGIPADKLNDPRVIHKEACINQHLADETYRLQVCLHEAAHAIYYERMDMRSVLIGPSISYDHEHDSFDKANATVTATHFIFSGVPIVGPRLDIDSSLFLPKARVDVAGGVVMRRLANIDDEGDDYDKKCFFSDFRNGGMPDAETQRLWGQAIADVEKDLRSPAFRRQLWDRAREFKREFDSKYKYVETPPEYFVVALDLEDAKETLDGNGNENGGVSFSFRVLEVVRESEAACAHAA
jgi:hypothetical protein